MNKLFSFAIPGLLLGFGLTASANTLSIDNAATIQAGSYGGGYGGEFPGTFNGNPIEVYCVDFTQDFTSGQTYTVHVNTPTSSTFTTQTHYGGYTGAWEYDNGTYNAVQRYEMSGWLASQLSSSKTQGTNDALQEAIWTLLDANIALAPYSCAGESASACQTAVTNDVSTAAADYASFITAVSYTHLDVYKRQEHGRRSSPPRWEGRRPGAFPATGYVGCVNQRNPGRGPATGGRVSFGNHARVGTEAPVDTTAHHPGRSQGP